jgi:uncharacterized protein involved in tolerance to divalent cations
VTVTVTVGAENPTESATVTVTVMVGAENPTEQVVSKALQIDAFVVCVSKTPKIRNLDRSHYIWSEKLTEKLSVVSYLPYFHRRFKRKDG